MIKIKNIFKSYVVNDNKHEVLNNISISFRKSELVSILGPSGSGKTTLLNIIAGLDSYDSGEIIINNKSTKKYLDSDWDNYRNNKIGFVFQNYNLIEHLTVLDNVSLSLTLSGLPKNEIKNKSIEVINKVGLKDSILKKPYQLSGGQMQRISIARALVNNPDIIVADEPTGALDSKTSIEVMEILKEISKEKLVIMVTHNSVLADKYSTRIINLEDGKIVNDTNPYNTTKNDNNVDIKKNKSMSFISSMMLSFYSLLTKKGRTLLTSFAGSIGIIGIALVLSLSNGVNKYIKDVEVNSISEFPIVIERKTYDVFGLVLNNRLEKCKKNKVCISKEKNSGVIKNNIKDFKNYIDITPNFKKYTSNIVSSYVIDLNVYNKDYNRVDKDLFKVISNNYEILYGRMPNEYNEIIVSVDNNNYISNNLLSILDVSNKNKNSYTYNEILSTSFKLVINTSFYKKENNNYINYSNDTEFVKNLVNNGVNLKVVGIIKDLDRSESYIGYSDKLTYYLIDNISKTDIYKDQLNNKEYNIISNIKFNNSDNTYEDIEKELGIYEINNPSRINLYAKDYKCKDKLISLIDEYNDKQINEDKISYNDMMKTLVDSLSKVLNMVSFILIAFASISLIVSSIMISIITYISVLERTKEIGILRAIGASKRDIKHIFQAETIIEGLLSGLMGVIITIIISLITNIVVYNITKIKNITILSMSNIIFLIVISILINLLSGLKPAKIASTKNPVEALKSE